jgi:hypothetical protein
MAKTLKFWNGRGHGRLNKHSLSVAAYSQKQARELLANACGVAISANEIRDYYSPCWGLSMNGVAIDGPCVYAIERYGSEIPFKIDTNNA